jgi:hypothetical protein
MLRSLKCVEGRTETNRPPEYRLFEIPPIRGGTSTTSASIGCDLCHIATCELDATSVVDARSADGAAAPRRHRAGRGVRRTLP